MTRITVASPRPRIAIVGTGISGLVSAYRLHDEHEITVFEASDRIGGHTNTVPIELDGKDYRIDTGFIVFNELHYPKFTRLLAELGVASRPTSMSFSVRCDRTGIEFNGTSLRTLFVQKRNLLRAGFWRMLRDIVRFGRTAPKLLEAPDSLSVRAYLESAGYSEGFRERYLLPLGSALWSCSSETFSSFPIRFVVEFLHNHHMLQLRDRPVWRVIEGGSHRYVSALTRPFRHRIRTRCAVRSIRRYDDHVKLIGATGSVERFDEVVLACHADQALRLLEDPSRDEERILSSFPYQRNEVALHTDTSVLPRDRRAWASWNYHIRTDRPRSATVTYDMNLLQGLVAPNEFCVTLNDTEGIDPAKILRRISYDHPTFDHRQSAAQKRHAELIRNRRTSYCGAYWGYGFHEDGVRSATAVTEAFGRQYVPQ